MPVKHSLFTTLAIAMTILAVPFAFGQADLYESRTLDFENISSTNVNSTVAEDTTNEKEVEFGDIDNDGDLDVVIAVARSDFSERRNKMYINDNGVLNEVSGTSIIADFSLRDVTRNAFLRDFDHDGWLDLITVSDSNDGDSTWTSSGRTKFYHNKHPNGVFSHFENETGRLNGARGAACSAWAGDFNNDGFCDFVMANYPFTSQNTMYFNNISVDGPGYFTDVTSTHVRQELDYDVDCCVADMNGDGKLDQIFTSRSDPNYIVYNDNMGNGEEIGDYRYSGPTNNTQFPSTGFEPAAEAADFDDDGKMDFIFVNKGGPATGTDVVMLNTGNDVNNKATFSEYPLPADVATNSKKATVADLDGNGLKDIIILSEVRRPYIYRNFSVEGNLHFVEWTPRNAFSSATAHRGWHAGSADVDGDDRPDILVGGNAGDHLFKNKVSAAFEEDNLNGDFPSFHNGAPVTVLGRAGKASPDTYTSTGVPSGAQVSIVLQSFSDVKLEVFDSSGTLIASSDLGLAHVGEAVQFDAPGGDFDVKVTMVQVSGDVNNDGVIGLADARAIRKCFLSREPECMIVDFDANGIINFFDARLFRGRYSGIGPGMDDYVLEIMSRTD